MTTPQRAAAGPAQPRPHSPDATMCRTNKAAMAPRLRVVGSSFFWPMRLLPAPRRNALQA